MKGDLHRGYDFYMIKPDRRDEVYCRVCGTKCDFSKGVESPVSMATSMAGIKVKHDQFTCPHYDEEWHYKAYKLLKELEETESKGVSKLIREDLDEILEEKMDTDSKRVSELIRQKKNEMSE